MIDLFELFRQKPATIGRLQRPPRGGLSVFRQLSDYSGT